MRYRALSFMTAMLFALSAPAPTPALAGQVLDRVLTRGKVVCGVDQTPGFGGFDDRGVPVGLEVDLCRAIAAAILKNPQAIQVQRVTTKYKFHALAEGELDVAFGMTTWTFDRDTTMMASFPAIAFYDGQGFMKWADIADPWAATSTICVQSGTTSANNLAEYLSRRKSAAKVLALSSSEEKFSAFAERRCTAVTGDSTELAVQKNRRSATQPSWVLLDTIISREPLGPAIFNNDPEWFSIVRWSMLIPIIAEARGLGRYNLESVPAADAELRRLLGEEPGFGANLRLDQAWARRIIASVGNYGEIFARNLAPLGIVRGQNALWSEGGLLYAPPLR
ncbi:amino-acid transporter subunit; periplasmic-binding component of ABC superfamily [Magnetospirillum gryphiswaldense MSR-1 v2]|uniref:Amino-acid transporter subunit periplasmic-binding component of ABC superfamily n=2 Tax=Magnetospirillum gryphiswaldense TaxID=55518 RepID=V6F654_MAGGM|nr:amino-acid transporter subunit; periplasmic-binding component of ABC superfamily [Magnetospirillum gryphiswaldense MSR-1 v2]